MKYSLLLAFVLCTSTSIQVYAQQQATVTNSLKNYAFLIGEWEGEGGGQPGLGKGSFSFKPELDGRIIVRKNRAEFAATAQRPAFVHDDMLIIYADQPGNPTKAILMDNEDHTIHYDVTFSEDKRSVIFTSSITEGMPVFRLTYVQVDANTVNIKFEMAQPGKPDTFNLYLEGKAHRKK
ncbi:MAG: hypothetical protein QM731_28420 [Chitinophagaceae bacterium]